MTPSDTGWPMNSDTWLPTAPARVTLTKPPGNTESALKVHTNRTLIEPVRTEHSGQTGLVRPHHLNNDLGQGCRGRLFPRVRALRGNGRAMSVDQIKTVAVLGAGTMGNGIAHVFARSGYKVILRDV